MIDILLLAVVGLIAWSVASEGAWSAAFTFVSVVLAGLIAMNFFEPLAAYLGSMISNSSSWGPRWDMIALVGLFALFTFLFRTATEYLAPTFMPVHPLVHEGGRWGFGVLSGYVTMAVLLTALHTAPLPREFIGFRPERRNLLGMAAPDRQWLGFTQHVSEKVLRTGRVFDGPTFTVGTVNNSVWPSFPIRYATRREKLSSGGGSGATVVRERRTSRSSSSSSKSKGSGRSGGSKAKGGPNF